MKSNIPVVVIVSWIEEEGHNNNDDNVVGYDGGC